MSYGKGLRMVQADLKRMAASLGEAAQTSLDNICSGRQRQVRILEEKLPIISEGLNYKVAGAFAAMSQGFGEHLRDVTHDIAELVSLVMASIDERVSSPTGVRKTRGLCRQAYTGLAQGGCGGDFPGASLVLRCFAWRVL